MIRAPGEHIGTAATGAVSPDRQFRSRLPIRVALFWLLVMRRDTARMAAAACLRMRGVQRLFRLPGSSDESADKELQEAHAVTVIGLLKNVVLTLGKGVIGVTANSQALLADALHSLSDIVADLVAMATLRIARLPADKDHPYGYGKYEPIGALCISGLLVSAGISLVWSSIDQVRETLASNLAPAVPGVAALWLGISNYVDRIDSKNRNR
jgi:hypothetical protein